MQGTQTPQFEAFLAAILDVFPDISHSFVLDLHNKCPVNGELEVAITIEDILGLSSYPKERDEMRKRRSEDESKETKNKANAWDVAQREAATKDDTRIAELLLKKEFPTITVAQINCTLRQKKFIHPAYQALADLMESKEPAIVARQRKRPRSYSEDAGPDRKYHRAAYEELEDARTVASQRTIERKAVELEVMREQAAIAAGDLVEWYMSHFNNGIQRRLLLASGCCFTDVPAFKTAHCGGATPHVFCFGCTKMNAETELGQGRCRPKCMDMSNCMALFLDHQLRQCIPKSVMDRLIRMRQREDLVAAEVGEVAECPFCDSLAIQPSIHIDREYRCGAPDCGRVSCRLCKADSHLPLSCEEAADIARRDKHLDARHVVEEAMSEALIRTCTKCQFKFVKVSGCNAMTCTRCGNRQCYVCGKAIGRDYAHFDVAGSKCDKFDKDDIELVHDVEVKKAQKAALAKVRAEAPDIGDEDLSIKVSEAVQKAEKESLERAARHGRHGIPNPPAHQPQGNPLPALPDVLHRHHQHLARHEDGNYADAHYHNRVVQNIPFDPLNRNRPQWPAPTPNHMGNLGNPFDPFLPFLPHGLAGPHALGAQGYHAFHAGMGGMFPPAVPDNPAVQAQYAADPYGYFTFPLPGTNARVVGQANQDGWQAFGALNYRNAPPNLPNPTLPAVNVPPVGQQAQIVDLHRRVINARQQVANAQRQVLAAGHQVANAHHQGIEAGQHVPNAHRGIADVHQPHRIDSEPPRALLETKDPSTRIIERLTKHRRRHQIPQIRDVAVENHVGKVHLDDAQQTMVLDNPPPRNIAAGQKRQSDLPRDAAARSRMEERSPKNLIDLTSE